MGTYNNGWGAGLLAALLGGCAWTVWRERREGERKLKNIRYILDVEETLFQASTDPAHFHTALERVAEYMGAERAFLWVEDGPARRRLWSGGGAEYPDSAVQGLEGEEVLTVPVRKRDGTAAGELGVVGPRRPWAGSEPLEQAAVSFAMGLEQYGAYQRLERLGHVDAMTGLRNRNRYLEALDWLGGHPPRSLGCVYLDANGLHELNNRLGHAAGDAMLIHVAEALTAAFPDDSTYRIGGDEFVALCLDRSEQELLCGVEQIRQQVRRSGYAVSAGAAWQDGGADVPGLVKRAEQAMREDKRAFYSGPERQHQLRVLDERSMRMFSRQRDMEAFLSAVAPRFKGVYFVDLDQDTIRYLFIPSYFKQILAEKDGKFSKGLLHYTSQLVCPEFREEFDRLCDYGQLKKRLDRGEVPELEYEKLDGDRMGLRVTRTEGGERGRETLWIFVLRPRAEAAPED